MAIELTESVQHKKLGGNDTFTVPAGKLLRIEYSPDGEEILSVEVPVGKEWHVGVVVDIEEVNA